MNTRSKKALASALGAATVAAGVAGTAFGQFSPTSGTAGNGGDGGSGTGSSISITTTATCGWHSASLSTAVVTKSGVRCGRFNAGNNGNISTRGKGGRGGNGGRSGNAFDRAPPPHFHRRTPSGGTRAAGRRQGSPCPLLRTEISSSAFEQSRRLVSLGKDPLRPRRGVLS